MKKLILGLIPIFLLQACATYSPKPGGQITKTPEQIYQEADYAVKIDIKYSRTYTAGTNWNFGSGIILKSKKYGFYVLTAQHIFSDHPDYTKMLAYFKDGSAPQPLKYAGLSRFYDAALLRFENPRFKPKKYAIIGKSSLLTPGSKIIAIGSNALGDFWFTSGNLYTKPSQLTERVITPLRLELYSKRWPTVILIDTTLFHGYSGGPLLNVKGELVGIAIGTLWFDGARISIGLPIDDVLKDAWYEYKK